MINYYILNFFYISEEDNAVEYTVELNKQGGNLGITVTGSDSTPREIVISVIIPGILKLLLGLL